MDEQAVKLYLLFGLIVFLIVISLFFKKKGKYILFGIILLAIFTFAYNEYTLPDRITEQYQDYEKMVKIHLEETYPDENWKLTYDENELTDLVGYEFYVVFENEPIVTYAYSVDAGEVIQVYAHTEDEYIEYKHTK